ncbi:MAG TPA: DUF1295 domain-containing protein [Bacilli bacterium]|nr:DUF1295 domain-containing protein [Bacilli bacterium]
MKTWIYKSKGNAMIAIAFIYIVAAVVAFILFNPILDVVRPFGFYPLIVTMFIVDVIATIIIYVFGVIFNNSSIYDPYWSVAPPVMFAAWIFITGQTDLFIIITMIAILVWAFRLTYNWAINFNGMHHQDWRYTMYKQNHPKLWQVINFFGIHFMPTLVVFLGLIPASFVILERQGTILFGWVIIGFVICLLAATIQFISDKAMKEFRDRNKGIKSRTHIDEGLWKYSRHPNYFGEVAFWWGLFIIQYGTSQNIYVIFGPIVVTLLFLFISIPLMEKHVLKSTPSYVTYQNQVSALIPWFRKQKKEGM